VADFFFSFAAQLRLVLQSAMAAIFAIRSGLNDASYPVEAVAVAFLLAIVPYLVLRGLVTRLTTKK
jgi:sorbitol-specific phosphotransferase system component IIC